MTSLENLQAKVSEIAAEIAQKEQSSAELRDGVHHADTELVAARARLASLKAAATGNPSLRGDLGEQLLTVDHLEALAAELARETEPQLVKLADDITQLQQKLAETKRLAARETLNALVGQYESLIRPAWALADLIRKQAALCGVPLEKEGPLLNRDRCTVAGYPLNTKPVQPQGDNNV